MNGARGNHGSECAARAQGRRQPARAIQGWPTIDAVAISSSNSAIETAPDTA